MRNWRTFSALALLVLALGLVAAGCGGDSASSAADDTTVETSGSVDDSTTEESTAEEVTTETEEATTEDTTDVDLGDLGGKCKDFAGTSAELAKAFGSANGPQDLGNVKKFFDEFAKDAPDEIKDDFATLAEAIGAMASALEGVDLSSTTPNPETLQKLQEALSSVDQTKLQEAQANITAWTKANC
jgi:ABC-type glycerol-3-phosphate transport system substrate-binding protein